MVYSFRQEKNEKICKMGAFFCTIHFMNRFFLSLTVCGGLFTAAGWPRLPRSFPEFEKRLNVETKTPLGTTALFLKSLLVYEKNPHLGRAMIRNLVAPELRVRRPGPEKKTVLTSRFRIYLRMLKKKNGGHIIRSYFIGAEPRNKYRPKTGALKVRYAYKKIRVWHHRRYYYARVWLKSSGADKPRRLLLRKYYLNGRFRWRVTKKCHEIFLPLERMP